MIEYEELKYLGEREVVSKSDIFNAFCDASKEEVDYEFDSCSGSILQKGMDAQDTKWANKIMAQLQEGLDDPLGVDDPLSILCKNRDKYQPIWKEKGYDISQSSGTSQEMKVTANVTNAPNMKVLSDSLVSQLALNFDVQPACAKGSVVPKVMGFLDAISKGRKGGCSSSYEVKEFACLFGKVDKAKGRIIVGAHFFKFVNEHQEKINGSLWTNSTVTDELKFVCKDVKFVLTKAPLDDEDPFA